jgi:hypothetical protein
VPAILTVIDSLPILSTDTTIYPDSTPSQGNTNSYNIHIGNHNVLHLTASFVGDMPMTYQWQTSLTNDGSGVTSVSGATNNVLTFSNPQTTNVSGYYRLAASNGQGGPVLSDWVYFGVLPAGGFQWSAKVPFAGLTAHQILSGTPGTPVGGETFGGANLVLVTNVPTAGVTNVITFYNDNTVATLTGGYTQRGSGNFIGNTGDTNLNAILDADTESANGSIATLNNLTSNQLYSVQLFAFNDTHAVGRIGYFLSPTNDTANVSETFTMGEDVYVVGTFTATNTTQQIAMFGDTGTYWTCEILRTVPLTPTVSISKVGATLQVAFANGVLYQATNVIGPWTSNTITSPYTFNPATNGTRMFFRAQSQ